MSTQWRIQKLREIAIRQLADKLSPLRKVDLAIECGIEPWLMAGYMELVTRRAYISEEEEDRLGPSRTSNLFRVRHRRFQAATLPYDVQSDIQTTFEREFASIAAFDSSPVSYRQPNFLTATDPNTIHRDQEYYCVDIIFQVNVFKSWPIQPTTHFVRWKIHYSSFLVIFSRSVQKCSEICFHFLLLKASHLMGVVMNNL
jgi:hypothetical protein